jgi:hypothetical protein
MQLKSIRIENFRSIEELTVNFESFSALVGANNSGKSTILRAIEIFFDSAPRLSAADFFMKEIERTIRITCVFYKFVRAERDEFGSSIIDEELSVNREFSKDGKDSGIYSVQVLGNPEFDEIRAASNATAKRSAYKRLTEGKYPDLPSATHAEAIDAAIGNWEDENKGQLQRIRHKGFFGASNVASGKLKKKTNINLIPAVKDVNAEIGSGKKSPALSLLLNITEQTIRNKEEFQNYFKEASEKFSTLTDPTTVPQLKEIGNQLTSCLQQYYSEATLTTSWEGVETLTVNFPVPQISVGHRDIDTGIDFVGHGLQRAVLFAIVQYLAQQQPIGEPVRAVHEEPQSDIILLIEEPEIFQHPGKQELIYEALSNIAGGFNTETGIRFQVIYTTHSERLVDIRNFDGVRVLRKRTTLEHPLETLCSAYSIDSCRESLRQLKDERQAAGREAFSAKLHIITKEVSEGFFADKIILVEGVSDKAVLEGLYRARGITPKKKGIFIIPVDGKGKFDKPILIFRGLGIPTYVIADNDERENKEEKRDIKTNILLQKMSGVDPIVDFPVGVFNDIAFFAGHLERYLKEMMGDNYLVIRDMVANSFGINPGDMDKTPAVVSAFLSEAQGAGYKFPLIEEMLSKIEMLGSR